MHNHLEADRCAWPPVPKQPRYRSASMDTRERSKPAIEEVKNSTTQDHASSMGKVVQPSYFESFGSFSG